MDPAAARSAPGSFTSSLASPGSSLNSPRRGARPGDLGFLAYEAVQGVDKKHHLKYDKEVGISAINTQRHNQFPQLPGTTFNEKSFASYVSTASSLRRTMQQQASPLRGSSPRKARG